MKLRENRFVTLIWNHATVDEFDSLLRSIEQPNRGCLEQAFALIVKLRGLSFDPVREAELDQMAEYLVRALRGKGAVAA